MKNITIIIPVHKLNGEEEQLLRNAINSVHECQNQYSDGMLNMLIVGPKDVCDYCNNSDLFQYPSTLVNDGETDFCSQINFAVDNIDTDYFSILELDDVYKSKWFKQAKEYYYGNESISIFIPLNVQHTEHKNWGFGNEFALSNSFITDDVDDTDEIGIINFKRIKNFPMFSLTGSIFNRNDFIKVGKFKPSIKVAFNYEFLLRLTNKGLKCMVVPKEGYIHEVGRKGSLIDTYSKELTDKEANDWNELALREYVYDEDRKKDISTISKEELK